MGEQRPLIRRSSRLLRALRTRWWYWRAYKCDVCGSADCTVNAHYYRCYTCHPETF